MKTKWKRLWSGILTAAMLFSLIPTAFAANNGTSSESAQLKIFHTLTYNGTTLASAEDLAKLSADNWTVDDGSFLETVNVTIENGSITLPVPSEVTEYTDSTKTTPVAKWTCTQYSLNWSNNITVDDWSNVTVSENQFSYQGEISYIWTREELETSKVTYDFGIATEGQTPSEGQLPATAKIVKINPGDLRLNTSQSYDGTNISVDVVQGLTASKIPSASAFKGVTDLIAYTETIDKDGNTITTWYEFMGWKESNETTSNTPGKERTLPTDDTYQLPTVGAEDINLVAYWREIPAEELASYAQQEGAPALGLTKKYLIDGKEYDSKISQHNSSTTDAWTQDGQANPLKLNNDRQVYYKATMQMDSSIASLLALGGNIQDASFAEFTINVDLDDNLELITDNNGNVTFKFTCTFLTPTGEILDSSKNKIDCTHETSDSDNVTSFTVSASKLPKEFSIPVKWKPGSYDANTLQEEIALEVAAAKISGNTAKTVMTTGIINGSIDLSKANQKESDIILAILSQKSWKEFYGDENGNVSALNALKANEHLKYAIKHLTLNANTVYAQVGKGDTIVPGENDPKPTINKSATALKNDQTDVTLSIGAKTSKTASDVVFVLDKSTSADVRNAAKAMLEELNKSAAENTIKVGVVIFNKTYNRVLELTELNDTTLSQIKAAIDTEVSDNTNLQAGLIGGKLMLDEDTTVSASAKHLVLVSDGITYIWNESTDKDSKQLSVYDEYKSTNEECLYIGPEDWAKHHTDSTSALFALSNPKQWMNTNQASFESQITTYADEYGQTQYRKSDDENYLNQKKHIPANQITSTGHATDFAMYEAAKVYQEIVDEGYHCYSYFGGQKDTGSATQVAESYPWAYAFMTNLNKIGGVSGAVPENVTGMFSDVKSSILNEIQSGTITDVIGADFTLTNKTITKDTFTLTANGETYTADKVDGNTVYFGTSSAGVYPFVLTYYNNGTAVKNTDGTYTITSGDVSYTYTPANTTSVVNGGASDEFFVLEMNIPVVSLTLKYNLTLTSKQTSPGNYTVPTNETAVLVYQPTTGDKEYTLEYNEPTVSYVVKNPTKPTTPVTPPPALNTEDHFAYIIGYPVDYYTGEPTDDQTKKPVKPEGNITRAEVATIFFRLLTDEVRNEYWSQTCEYSDVDIDDWFNNAVCTLSNFGILKGYEDGTFRPNGNITRAEFATIAVRFFEVEYNGKDLFPDIDGHWAQDYINQAGFAGLVEGYPDGTFGPEKLITRAEAVTIVNRTIDRHPDKEHLLDDMLVWPDNMDTTKWYYADMQEATNSHEYTMHTKTAETESQTKYEIWQKILPVRDWEAFEKAWADANAAANPGEVVR